MAQEVFGFCAVRLEPKLMNRCRPEKIEERYRTETAEGWNVEGERRRVTRKECKRLGEEFKFGGSMAQKGLWNLSKRLLEDRGALLKK